MSQSFKSWIHFRIWVQYPWCHWVITLYSNELFGWNNHESCHLTVVVWIILRYNQHRKKRHLIAHVSSTFSEGKQHFFKMSKPMFIFLFLGGEWTFIWNFVQFNFLMNELLFSSSALTLPLTPLWKESNDTLAVTPLNISFLPSFLIFPSLSWSHREKRNTKIKERRMIAKSDSFCQTSVTRTFPCPTVTPKAAGCVASYTNKCKDKSTPPTERSGDGIMITN